MIPVVWCTSPGAWFRACCRPSEVRPRPHAGVRAAHTNKCAEHHERPVVSQQVPFKVDSAILVLSQRIFGTGCTWYLTPVPRKHVQYLVHKLGGNSKSGAVAKKFTVDSTARPVSLYLVF